MLPADVLAQLEIIGRRADMQALTINQLERTSDPLRGKDEPLKREAGA